MYRRTMYGRTGQAGFTIIEIFITLGILGVLVSLALPSMKAFMDTQSVKTPSSDLYVSLVLARSEALKRNSAVDLEPVNPGDWAQGWKVKIQSGGTVLRTQDPMPNVTILANIGGNLTYGSNGRLVTSTTLFRVIGGSQARMRCVSVSPSGRPNVRVDSNTDSTLCD